MSVPRWVDGVRRSLPSLRLIRGPLHYKPRVRSTQVEASVLASAGAPEGTIVVAGVQTEGRGRMGRSWVSPPGGLWMSILLRPEGAVKQVHLVTLAAALSVVEGLSALSMPRSSIMWPNDVVIGEGKAAGILAEGVFVGSKLDYVVLGIGLNVNNQVRHLERILGRPATSLREECGHCLDLGKMALSILGRLNDNYFASQQDGWSHLLPKVKTHMCTIRATISLTTENEEIVGFAVDLSNDGGLVIITRNGYARVIRPEDVLQVRIVDTSPPTNRRKGEEP